MHVYTEWVWVFFNTRRSWETKSPYTSDAVTSWEAEAGLVRAEKCSRNPGNSAEVPSFWGQWMLSNQSSTHVEPLGLFVFRFFLLVVFSEDVWSSTTRSKTKFASLPAYTPQTTKLKQKPWKQQQLILKPALMLLPMLSSLQTPCTSCRPSSQIGTLNSMTCLLLLPHCVDAMQSPYNGYHRTAACLAMRLLTLWQRRAQQKSKWIDPPATLRWRPSSRPSNTASGGTSTHGTTRLTPITC